MNKQPSNITANSLIVQGAREHNLQNVKLELPRDSMIVFTGLSGSGKSSLAFDTIFAEGQRRYVESLSAYARQFLGQIDKPDVDFIDGLSPAVSIDQKSTNRNPRSTVGTVTEIYDYLRLLWARIGTPHCSTCGEIISSQSPQSIVDKLMTLEENTRFQILSPIVRERKGEHVELLQEISTKGYSRARIDGEIVSLSEEHKLSKQKKHTIEVIVDRLAISQDIKSRLVDSIETSLKLGNGKILIDFVDIPKNSPERQKIFSESFACPNEHDLEIEEIEPRIFSFNGPFGACPGCLGIGKKQEIDLELIVPDTSISIKDGAIVPWSFGYGMSEYFLRLLEALSEDIDFSLTQPWKKLSAESKEAILQGKNHKVEVNYQNKYGRERKYSTGFEGVIPYLKRKHSETESEQARQRYQEYMREIPCTDCEGDRLKKSVLAIKINDMNISQIANLSLKECKNFMDNIQLSDREAKIATQILTEVRARLTFLLDVGLEYLSLSRAAGTLSGGESQRIRLATQIGSGLVGVLYVLDEPSIGLHQRDNRKLIETLTRLRDLGNTLIVVEHDEDTIRAADWIVDIGPGAGENGGQVVHSGDYKSLLNNTKSITGNYLSKRQKIAVPEKWRKKNSEKEIRIIGARENNLQNITAKFPLGMFVAVTGVSGSGKSTLVNGILYKILANKLNGARQVPGKYTKITGIEHLDKVVHVDQSPIGRTPRSNPATYTGVFDNIRKLFAETNMAKTRGYLPGRFSFNVKGGRCEPCSGDGTLKIEMNFLPDVYVPCEICRGSRYNRETLEVLYKNKNISDVLHMPIEEAAEFFSAFTPIARHLNTLVDVGLGYVRLGQPATTLSGGEAQRVKLASELQKRATGRTIYVLDEPTTGLHFEDIRKLLIVLQELVNKGNSVIVIEHNLDVIKTADHIIDMGPEGGSGGGSIVATGDPLRVAKNPSSHTGKFLAELLVEEK